MFLSITQKAVTEADACHVLEQAYSLERPFGIPTLVLNPEHLYLSETLTQEWTRKKNMAFVYGSDRRPLSAIFSEALEKCPELSQHDAADIQNELCTAKSASNALNDVVMGEYGAYAHPMKNMQCSEFAHNYTEPSYISPAFNTVFIPRENFSAHDRLASALKATKDEIPNYLPGYDSQYHFLILTHEMGHGTGAGEAQTDMMAALACRQAFADTRFVSAWSDIRALSLIYHRDGAWQKQGYHWSMVESLDRVIAIHESAIDAMTEHDIKALRFENFPHVDEQWEALHIIFGVASAHGGNNFIDAYKKKNLPAIAQAIRDMPITQLSDDAKIIALRLALAAERLSTPGAYDINPPHPGPR